MPMYRDSKLAERIHASTKTVKKPPVKRKTVKTGNARIDSVNNPERTIKQLFKEMRPK